MAPAALCVCTLVEHELLYGFALLPGTRAEAMTLRLLELLPSLPFGSAEARRAATLRVVLARSGKPIGPYDTLIGATALEHGLTLVTRLGHAQHARVSARRRPGRRGLARLSLVLYLGENVLPAGQDLWAVPNKRAMGARGSK